MTDRELFEDRVFLDYFIRSIRLNDTVPQPKISGALDYVPTCELNKAQLCEKDEEGRYKQEEISAMWHGWCLHRDRNGLI